MSETKTTPAVQPTRRTSAPITKVKTLQELFDHPELKERMAQLVPKHLGVERMLKTFQGSVLKTPGLAKASPLSMLGCAMTVAYLGLEPNTPLGLMYLIPFDVNTFNRSTKKWDYVRTDVTPIVGYEGYLDLISRGGMCKDVDCQLIWPGDVWENERGSERHFRHIQKFKPHDPAAEPDFAYMFARTTNGGEYVELMDRNEVHRVRNMSQGYRTAKAAYDKATADGHKPSKAYTEAPWIKHANAMWRKTPLRQGQKWIPGRTPEMGMAAHLDELGDTNRVRFDKVLDVEQVIEGSWEATDEEMDMGEGPEAEDTRRPQVQGANLGKTADDPGQSQQGPVEGKPTATRKAPAKKAAASPPANEEPPDDRWPPAGDQPSGPATSPAAAATQPEVSDRLQGNEASGLPAFDTFLLDTDGEPVGEPFTDPMKFTQELGNHLAANVDRWDNILQQNADAIDMVRASKDQVAINTLETVINPPAVADAEPEEPEQSEEGPPGAIVVPMTYDRGKLMEQQYKVDFDREVGSLVRANLMDFIELNRANMLKVRKSYSALLVKGLDLKARELGMPLTAEQRTSLLVAAPTVVTPSSKTVQQPEDEYEALVRSRLQAIESCTMLSDLEMLNKGPILSGFADRMRRDGKLDLLARVQNAFLARKATLSGPPS